MRKFFVMTSLLAGAMLSPLLAQDVKPATPDTTPVIKAPEVAPAPLPVKITQWSHNKIGTVALTFDRGAATDYTTVFPLLKERGLRGTFNVMTSAVEKPGYVTWEQLREMSKAGMEIGSNSTTAKYSADVTADLRDSRDKIDKEITTQKCVVLAFLSGAAKKEADGLYISARFQSKKFFYPHWPMLFMNMEDYYISGANAADMKDVVDKCIEKKAMSILNYRDTTNKVFPEQLDLLKKNEDSLWLATYGEVARYIREARQSKITMTAQDEKSVRFTFTDGLADETFNLPLTFAYENTNKWEQIEVKQGDKPVWSQLTGTTLLFEAVPDAGEVVIAPVPVVAVVK